MSKFLRFPGKWLLWGPLVAVAAACTTEPEPPAPTPTSMTVVSGDAQSGTVNTTLGQSLVVRVNDQDGTAMSGIGVTFAVTSGDGTPSSPTANTNAQSQIDWLFGLI